MGLRWRVGARFIALNSYESDGDCFLGGGCWGGGAVPLRLLSAVDLVLVAEIWGKCCSGMAEQNESGVWGLMLLGLMWWLGWELHSWGVWLPSLWRCDVLGRCSGVWGRPTGSQTIVL